MTDAAAPVLVVDEHELAAVGLRLALSTMGWVSEACCGAAHDVVEHARRIAPWCVLIGSRAGDDVGERTALVEALAATGGEVVILTTERRRVRLAEYLEAGAAGWIPRSVSLDELHSVLSDLRSGGSVIGRTERVALFDLLRRERERERRLRAVFERLTNRESLVLAALADGMSAEQIAREHFVAVATIRSQIRSILQKLDVRSQLAAASLGGEYRELLPECERSSRDRRRLRGAEPCPVEPAVGVSVEIA